MPSKKKIAAIVTEYRHFSHAEHIVDRFLMGYPIDGRYHYPDFEVVSMYTDLVPENDLSRERAGTFGFTIYPTVPETLCNGGSALAADAVLLVGEHGDYPRNEKGQKLYPRHELFKQIVAVFEQSGRACPVFNDKHLSYSFEKAKWMVDAAKRLGFPFLAGSSIPVTWRLPALELPLGCEIESALAVGHGGLDSYDYHALEGLQCMVERRKGGETGVKAVQYIEGDAVWKAGEAGVWSYELLASALSRSDTPQGNAVADGRPEDVVRLGLLSQLAKAPAAYIVEYTDGLVGTMLMLNGVIKDFTFACRLRGEETIASTQFFLPPQPNVNYFSCLVAKIEEMFVTGVAPYPVQRTLLVSGILEACLNARHQGVRRLETPFLNVSYQTPTASHFCGSASGEKG